MSSMRADIRPHSTDPEVAVASNNGLRTTMNCRFLSGFTPRVFVAIAALLIAPSFAPAATAQPAPASAYTTGFIDTGGARVYYLDYGGSGLPVVLDSYAAEDLAPRLADEHRVVVITLHRASDSPVASGAETVERRARELLDLLDTLGFDRFVLVTAFYPRATTYLAEHHPERLAGVVYLTGAPEVIDYIELDPTGGYQLLFRGLPEEFKAEIVEGMDYRPRHLGIDAMTIDVPALVLTPRSGSLTPPSDLLSNGPRLANLPFFRDAEARAYFERLAEDEALREQVSEFQDEVVGPRIRQHGEAFRRAFGEKLRVESLDVPRLAPPVFRSSPELFHTPIERFLADIRGEVGRP
jgi:pimeloyl-ACP methyl ester carboxylesterase